jgi:hypothetical protein
MGPTENQRHHQSTDPSDGDLASAEGFRVCRGRLSDASSVRARRVAIGRGRRDFTRNKWRPLPDRALRRSSWRHPVVDRTPLRHLVWADCERESTRSGGATSDWDGANREDSIARSPSDWHRVLLSRRGSNTVLVDDRRRQLDAAVASWTAQGWAIQNQTADSAVLNRSAESMLVSVDKAGDVSTRPLPAP